MVHVVRWDKISSPDSNFFDQTRANERRKGVIKRVANTKPRQERQRQQTTRTNHNRTAFTNVDDKDVLATTRMDDPVGSAGRGGRLVDNGAAAAASTIVVDGATESRSSTSPFVARRNNNHWRNRN
jgi:hypothetical protein